MIETVLLMQDVPSECMVQARIKHGECVNRGKSGIQNLTSQHFFEYQLNFFWHTNMSNTSLKRIVTDSYFYTMSVDVG